MLIRCKHDTALAAIVTVTTTAASANIVTIAEEGEEDGQSTSNKQQLATITERHPLNKDEVNTIFNGNSTLFTLAVSAMTRLGEACVLLGKDTYLANEVYQEVMELVSAIGHSPSTTRNNNIITAPIFKLGLSFTITTRATTADRTTRS